ncbi:MAG: hypothetical protein NTX50_06590 [Candidatus Sumerlaeota bacterium]|nr:hypothetical protein [Candidatus Sumerlaeota bacterium]
MLATVEGIYRHGKVELIEAPQDWNEEAPVLVTCLTESHEKNTIDLRARGINEEEAAELRDHLSAFAEDWDSPEMSAYDNYQAPHL